MSDKLPAILLFSGGLSSFIAHSYLDNVPTVFFKLPTNKNNLIAINRLLPKTLIDQTFAQCTELTLDHNKPIRVALLALFAARYADKIYVASCDTTPTITPQLLVQLSKVAGLMFGKIVILSPLWHLTKVELVRWYLSTISGNREDKIQRLLETDSCDKGEIWCGGCAGCFEKWMAFYLNGIHLPFRDDNVLSQVFEDAKSKLILMGEVRRSNILSVIAAYRGWKR